jgi:hypothetical protein
LGRRAAKRNGLPRKPQPQKTKKGPFGAKWFAERALVYREKPTTPEAGQGWVAILGRLLV